MSGETGQPVRVAELFDALSRDYDNVGVEFFGPIARSLVSELAPERGESWLDIGCGRGAALLAAAERVGPSGRAVGIDISPAMVELARAEAAARGLTHVRVAVDDAQGPRMSAASFDVVSSCLVLFFLRDPSAALKAWFDRVAPGGRLGVTTFGPQDARWRQVDDVITSHLPAGMRDARTSGTQGPFASDAGMEQLVADAGFVDVRTVVEDIPVRFADLEHWHAFSWSTGQRQAWLAIPEDKRAEVRAQAERRIAPHVQPDGSFTFVQQVRHTLAWREV
jgi:ubiquinone/menaquinone biosynthesis C-methylase UbiE